MLHIKFNVKFCINCQALFVFKKIYIKNPETLLMQTKQKNKIKFYEKFQ